MNARMEEADVKGRGEVIYFLGGRGDRMGRFDPYTKQRLLAHELVHSMARFQTAEPTTKMAAKLRLAPFFYFLFFFQIFELITLK